MDNLEIEKKIEQKPGLERESGDFSLEEQENKGEAQEIPENLEHFEKTQENLELPKELAPKVKGKDTVGAPGIDTKDSPLHQEVEAILEEELEQIYFKMDLKTQEKFKKKGEETTSKIVKLVTEGKATFIKIFKLIFGWLRIIPGVNKYYLEQEAKLKADRIIKIKN